MHATDSFIINGLEERRKHKSPEIDVVTCGRFVVPEQRSAPSSITFSTAGKLEKANVRLISTLFPFHCLVFHPLFSKEQRFPEQCTFETSPDVKFVTGKENVISIFQDETGFGNVTWSVPVAPVSHLLVLLKVDSQEPETPLEPVKELMNVWDF